MKLLFVLLSLVVVFFAPMMTSAQGTTTPVVPTAATANLPLTITLVTPVSDTIIDVVFSEDIDIATIRATLEDVASRESLRVLNSAVGAKPNVIRFFLEKPLKTTNNYRLTFNSVMSLSGKTITVGLDAIREFTTPAQFSPVVENSLPTPENPAIPTNSNAVSKNSGNFTEVLSKNTQKDMTATGKTNTGVLNSLKKLPEAGSGMMIFAALMGLLLTFLILTQKKKA